MKVRAGPPPPLILASTSPHRKRLLQRLRVEFACAAPDCDETPIDGEPFPARALRLAEEKAKSVESEHPGALIIGGDQTIAGVGGIYDKPGNRARAVAQLKKMRGMDFIFHTAVCARFGGKNESVLITHRASMRLLTDEEIERYVKKEPSFNCAGGAQLEGLGVSLMESIEGGDPTALTGMPLITVARMLRARGFDAP